MIDFDIENELSPNLTQGEKIIWTGRPRTGILLRSADVFMIPFSLLYGGFAFFWETTVITSGAPFFFRLWGIPFVLVGLYIIIGRFFLDARMRQNTIYAFTDSRIIIKSGIFSKELKSLNIRTLSDVTVSEKPDGSGTITLGPTDLRSGMMSGIGMQWPGLKQVPQLEFIENAQSVYKQIMSLQK